MKKASYMKLVTALTAILLAFVLTIMFSYSGFATETETEYKFGAENLGTVREYWCDELTAEILENRGSDIIIEKIIGLCLDSEGNGRIVNTANPEYDYISYRSVPGVYQGDLVLTICIYQPNNAYVDDVVARFDYVLGK